MSVSAVVVALTALGPATVPTRVAMPPWTSTSTHAGLVQQLADVAALELARRPGWVVLSAAELQLLVAHQRDLHDVLACTGEAECLAKLSRAVEAEKFLSGRLDRLGESWLLTLSWADTGTRARSRGEALVADSELELVVGLPGLLDKLTGEVTQQTTSGTVAPPGSRVALLEVESADPRAPLGASIEPLVALELKRAGLEVVSRDEVRAMLTYEADKQIVVGRADSAMLAEIGGALGVDYLVAGTVGRLGPRYVLHLKLMSVRRAAVVGRVSESFEGPEPLLAPATRVAVRALVGAPPGAPGALEVRTEATGVADVDARILPLPTPFEGLAAGRHRVRVEAEGYLPLEQDVYVEPGQRLRWRPPLVEVEVPLLERWWVWTAAGAIVAASVGIAVAASASPELGTVEGRVVIPRP